MNYVFLGLSITSSWGNGHATTYRSLLRGLVANGQRVTFLERDVPWYRPHRDLVEARGSAREQNMELPGARVLLYQDLQQLQRDHGATVRDADAVILGSYVPDGIEVAHWMLRTARGVRVFYDIDTPITLAGLDDGGTSYLTRSLVPRFDLYLSFTGGTMLERLTREFKAKRACPLYCSVDPSSYYPEPRAHSWALGYLGTYSADRQAALEELLLAPARSLPGRTFVVAGAQYPAACAWPQNLEHQEHIAPSQHRAFYAQQRFTLNLTRAEMIRSGYSPSVRLFEAAACGAPIISDSWPGLSELFVPDKEILLARTTSDVIGYLRDIDDARRAAIARAARGRVLAEHTSRHRAAALERYVREASGCTPSASWNRHPENLEQSDG
jgi:spore maturation protein CgeB